MSFSVYTELSSTYIVYVVFSLTKPIKYSMDFDCSICNYSTQFNDNALLCAVGSIFLRIFRNERTVSFDRNVCLLN